MRTDQWNVVVPCTVLELPFCDRSISGRSSERLKPASGGDPPGTKIE